MSRSEPGVTMRAVPGRTHRRRTVGRSRSWMRRARSARTSSKGAMVLVVVTLVAIAWQSVAASGSVPALRRAPYTNEVVGNSATVSWGTDRSQTTGTATWGVVSNGQCTPSNSVTATRASITVGSTSRVPVDRLLAFPGPGTYCYRVKLGRRRPARHGSVAAGQDGGCSGHVVLVRRVRRLGRGHRRIRRT